MAPDTEHALKALPRTGVRVIKQQVLSGHLSEPEEDLLAIEDPLEITLLYPRGTTLVENKLGITMRTPGHDDELIHGFLFCEGLIQGAHDITSIEYATQGEAAPTAAKVTLRTSEDLPPEHKMPGFSAFSSCGVCGTPALDQLALPTSLRIEDTVRFSAQWIHSLPERMEQEQAVFQQTGGLHAAAIFRQDRDCLSIHEDIGRHNALDKAIGANLLAGRLPEPGTVLCVSGRMSYEILQKALMARIPIIAGIGAPSSQAVALANDFKITLIGFLRKSRYNIYSCPERLRF